APEPPAMRALRLSAPAILSVALATMPLCGQAAPDTGLPVRVGAFLDAYYAWDFNRPRALDRAFTTQPARHNEFNVNLAHLEAVLSAPKVRGRLALQYGTSVQANYEGEPRVGSRSGGEIARHLQEATIGVQLAPSLWLDGGISLSHIGSESWISRDNLTYTRSLIADFSPYYQSGVKLTWQASSSVTAQLHVVNGWQTISESNSDKSIGGRIDWVASPRVTVSAYNLIGNELPDSVERRVRVFHGTSVKVTPNARVTLQGTLDYGWQALGDGTGRWYGFALVGRMQLTGSAALVGRVERYEDPKQVIVATGSGTSFRAGGGSIGLDVTPAPRLLWRTELRGLTGDGAIFPARGPPTTSTAFVVSSLALTL
ncbi:MAG TPA: porin, partial [Gemmatimonadaceae bacterium]|nr:porin [Gemmatimonadaceae bacterium]